MCKKSIFKKLLIKLTKECTFSVNNGLIKQIDGCHMGGPISVVFADIYMCKMEDNVVAPLKPIFYIRYVDDTYLRKKNTTEKLFEKLNTYHDNIKLTIFPIHAINEVFHRFNQQKDEVLTRQWFFDDRKECMIRLPFAPANEKFVNKLEIFTNNSIKFNIVWNNQKIKSLFNYKDKVSYYSCIIYRGI